MHCFARRFVVLASSLAAPWAAGEGIYRCGNSYGTQPCPGGSAIAAVPAPSAAEAAQARRGAQADAKRADELQKARLERERNAPPAVIPQEGKQDKPPAPEGSRKAGKDKDARKEPAHFTAAGPRPPSKPGR